MFLSLGEGHSCFSFLRFINLAPSEACSIMTKDIAFRFMFLLLLLEDAYRLYHRRLWNDGAQQTRYVHCSKFAFIAFASTHSTNALLLNNTVQYIMHCHTIYYYAILSYTIPHAIPCHTIYHTVSYYVYTIPHAMPYHTIYHTIYTLYSAIPHAMSYQAEPYYQTLPDDTIAALVNFSLIVMFSFFFIGFSIATTSYCGRHFVCPSRKFNLDQSQVS